MLRQHLPRIVDLDGPEGLLGEATDNEVAHSEEQLLVPLDLSVLPAPLGQDRFEPEPLRQRVAADEGLVGVSDVRLVVRLRDLRKVEQARIRRHLLRKELISQQQILGPIVLCEARSRDFILHF